MHLRKRVILFVSLFVFVAISSAGLFQDISSQDFENGTYYRTFYNSSGFVQLNYSQLIGNFSSRIFDASSNSTWINMSTTNELCYGCELPNSGVIEQGNFIRPVNVSGIVLLSHMNELSGNVGDYSPYGNTGTVTLFEGNEYGFSGKFNTSLDFEANDGDLIDYGSPSQYNFGNQLTIEAWINPESFNSITSNGFPTFVDKATNSLSFYFDRIGSTNTGSLVGLVVADNSAVASGTKVFNVGEWYHVALVYDGSQVRLYSNGVLDGSPISKTGNVVSNSVSLIVGSGWRLSSPDYYRFDGKIDEIAIYNRSLSAEEIRDRYLRGILRLNLSARSCDDPLCVGEPYQIISDRSNLSLIDNRYFQYKLDFGTEDGGYTPKLYNSSIGYLATNLAPLVNITYPSNNSNHSTLLTDINYTIMDSNLDSCWYSIDYGLVNNTIVCGQNVTGISSSEGNNLWRVYANDSLGSTSLSSVSFFVDSLPPSISMIQPINNSLLTNRTVFVNYTVSDVGIGLQSCWWTNSSGILNNSINCGMNFSFVGSEGSNYITIYANDTFGNARGITNIITINTQAPSVSISYPVDGSVIGNITGISLNYSVIDSNLQSCWYTFTYGFTNFTLSNCQNTTFNMSSQGIYEIKIYANDTTGNIGFDSNTFTVSVDSPSIDPISPVNSYLGPISLSKVNFAYIPGDFDLDSCSLWINSTGTFLLNQTNNTVSSGQQNYFSLNLTSILEGSYSWAIECNDSLGHNSMTGNQTFYIDRTIPSLTILKPTGNYNSVTNIPISLNYTDTSPVKCRYNVTFASTGNVVLGDSELLNCESTTFNVDTEASYFLWMSVNDSAGNVNNTRSSFTVSSNNNGGPTGGSGGGGGGSGGGSLIGFAPYNLFIEDLEELKIGRGKSEAVELKVSNRGIKFLNDCYFIPSGGISQWISGSDIYSLGPGQTTSYIFNVNAPIDSEVGDYFATLNIMCNEINSSLSYHVSVIGGEFELNILESRRIGTRLSAKYTIENFANEAKNLTVNYKLLNNKGELLVEGSFDPLQVPANEKLDSLGEFELPKNSIGDYTLIMEVSDGFDSSQKQQKIRLASEGISGFVISEGNLRTVTWFGIIVALSFGVFLVAKVLIKQAAIKRVASNNRNFIAIEPN